MHADTTDNLAPPSGAADDVTTLYREHALGLIRLAVVMLGDRPAAEDVVQEAFCGLYRRWHTLADPAKALAYARSSVINGCRSVLRRRRWPLGDLAGETAGESAEAAALVSEEHREVLTAVRRLPDRQREVLVLRFYLDLDEGEIAAALRISRGTVKSTTSRGIAALGRMLERSHEHDRGPDPGGGARGREHGAAGRRAAAATAGTGGAGEASTWLGCAGRAGAGRAGPAGRGLAGWVAGGGQRARWVAPVAAAVAVVVVVVAASVIAGRGMAGAPAAGRGSTAGSTSVAELVKSGQIPPYYLEVTGTGADGLDGPSYVVVRATATGKALDTIRPSVPGDGIMGVTGAADDRTFILDEQPLAKRDGDLGREPHTFYEVRLDAAGKPGPATKLPLSLPRNRLLDAFSLSPDGSKLAMAVQPFPDGKNPGSATVTVYTLATGQSHSWTGNGQVGFDPQSLSWTSDGQTLAVQWNENSTDPAASGFYVLHLAQGGAPGSRQPRGDPVRQQLRVRVGCIQAGVTITADGSALTCAGVRTSIPTRLPTASKHRPPSWSSPPPPGSCCASSAAGTAWPSRP